ncbi:MAG: Rrf2 family transcriptional regulator [Helicobacteraceae bacterium]|nr:Rrf2 family transcriptional regulator [Helicobacteraceae bacterium]
MQLSSTSRYSIRILSYIASKDKDKLYSAKEISEALVIPYKYLTKIMTDLAKADLILSIRGREGGYKLAREASQIVISDILNVCNQSISDTECILGGVCDSEHKCSLHDQWVDPKDMIKKMFNETTLDNLEGQNFKM